MKRRIIALVMAVFCALSLSAQESGYVSVSVQDLLSLRDIIEQQRLEAAQLRQRLEQEAALASELSKRLSISAGSLMFTAKTLMTSQIDSEMMRMERDALKIELKKVRLSSTVSWVVSVSLAIFCMLRFIKL